MTRLVELTERGSGNSVWIAPDHVAAVKTFNEDDGGWTVIHLVSRESVAVQEGAAAVAKLLNSVRGA